MNDVNCVMDINHDSGQMLQESTFKGMEELNVLLKSTFQRCALSGVVDKKIQNRCFHESFVKYLYMSEKPPNDSQNLEPMFRGFLKFRCFY